MDRKNFLKFAMATLGCKINQSDAASLEADLLERGYTLVSFQQPADAYIIHTCTVTQKSDYQSRQLIRRAILRNPGAQVIVTGCYAQVAPEVLKEIPGVDFVVGIHDRGRIPGIVDSREKSNPGQTFASEVEKGNNFEEEKLPSFLGRARAYLKVQDGCNSSCSYCIVPQARGRSRSISPDLALANARELCRQGFKELILTGIHLGIYGEDLPPRHSLLELLQSLERENQEFRVRLSSIEPGEFHPPLIDFLAGSEKICPHLHIPVQSGDDGILRKMNRNYSRTFFEDLVYRLMQAIPALAIGVDLIAGFPGEDDQAFANTMSLVEKLPLAYLHVFPFSKRKGARAGGFPGQIHSRVIKARCRALRTLGDKKRERFYTSFLGREVKVLIEGQRDRQSGMLKGYSENYIPVLLQGGEELMNRELRVEVTEVKDGKVKGKLAGFGDKGCEKKC